MIELNGKYNNAKIFTDNVDNETINQIITLLNQESIKDSKIRIMPDTHAGAGCVIGTTMTITDKVIPNLVGVDIGCGMECVELSEDSIIDLPKLDKLIYDKIPSGFNIRDTNHPYLSNVNLSNLYCINKINLEKAEKSLGTLGGGNHFIEVDKTDFGQYYLVIHTGSRNLGKQVAEYYQKEAYNLLSIENKKDKIKEVIKKLKLEGRQCEISNAIKKINQTQIKVPKELAYCEGKLFDDYIHDMKIIQEYATWNRKAIADVILQGMNWKKKSEFTTIHNYIDIDNMILRKGSVSAQNGEKLIIPINMRDGSLICVGKGNSDWNYSAPHGAGRLMSRSQAKEQVSLKDYQNTMKEAGIYSTSVNASTLDESPMAYKPIDEIIENIEPTVDIINIIKPIYNFKASELTKELNLINDIEEDIDFDI